MAVVDSTGAAISVGQTVKLVATVAAVNQNAPHGDEVTLTLSHPPGANRAGQMQNLQQSILFTAQCANTTPQGGTFSLPGEILTIGA